MASSSNPNDAQSRLAKVSLSGSTAKVNRPGGNSKNGRENALNLLGSILDDSAAEAEQEHAKNEANRKRAEEEARLQRERDEEMAKLEAERALVAEQQELEDLKLKQAQMQAQLQREKDIEAGLIDLEEEARQKKAEEDRIAAEAAAKAKKEADRREAEALRIAQQNELNALNQEQLNAAMTAKNPYIPVIIVAIIFLVIAGCFAAYYLIKQSNKPNDFYCAADSYAAQELSTAQESTLGMVSVNVSLVKQAEDPKPVKKSRPKAAAPAAAKPKPSGLGGGRRLFGGGL